MRVRKAVDHPKHAARYTPAVRSIMPMAFRNPPELTIAIGVVCLAIAAFSDAWSLAVFGAILALLGVRDCWRERRRHE
jgi:hypothetical protein